MYPVVVFHALRVGIGDASVVRRKAVDLGLAVLPDSTRDILVIWIEQSDGATVALTPGPWSLIPGP
jgi:putative transposase